MANPHEWIWRYGVSDDLVIGEIKPALHILGPVSLEGSTNHDFKGSGLMVEVDLLEQDRSRHCDFTEGTGTGGRKGQDFGAARTLAASPFEVLSWETLGRNVETPDCLGHASDIHCAR